MDNLCLEIPGRKTYIYPGCTVKLHRFESETWIVCFGWFSFGGNRPMCGWYLSKDCGATVKPLQLPDLDDIYLVEMR